MEKPVRPVCLISGGGTGIGAATATTLADAGCDVVINFHRSAAEARRIADSCIERGAKALIVKGNVAEAANCEDLGSLDRSDFDAIFSVNVIGCYQLTRAAISALKQAPTASVVNVSS